MNFRNRKLVTTVRIILGLFMAMSGVTGLMAAANDMQSIPVPMIPYMKQLAVMNLFQLVKIAELVAGLMLVFGIFPALAAIFLAPILIGALVFNITLAPAFVITPVILMALTAYLGYAYWDKYKALFERK